MFYQEKKLFPTTQSPVRKFPIISPDLKTQPPLQSLHKRWHSPHMKPVFNAPASAAAAGNGWYMLYNHRGRENPHFSAEPSTENTDRKHSNHVKDRDAAESQTEDGGWRSRRAGDELDQQSHLSDLCWSLIRLCNYRVLTLRRRCYRKREKAFLRVPSGVIRVGTCKQMQNLNPSIHHETVNTQSSYSKEELLINTQKCASQLIYFAL